MDEKFIIQSEPKTMGQLGYNFEGLKKVIQFFKHFLTEFCSLISIRTALLHSRERSGL